jgi:HSP20 family protein
MTSLIRKPLPGLVNSFTDLFNAPLFGEDFNFNNLVPAVNIREEADAFYIEFAAPGLKKEDFKIKLADGMLTVSSEKREEKEEADKNYTRKEFSYATFSRSFRLPENANQDAIKATYKDGVLHLNIAKLIAKPEKNKTIEVG